MTFPMTLLPPAEAIPILLDRARSPVVALDTEFDLEDGNLPTCRAPLNGLSMAGGTPEAGLVGTFWSFGKWGEDTPWATLRERVLRPIFGDPDRIAVLHPPKTDMQILRQRGIGEADVRCAIECTMAQVHVFDENLPKGLKELAACLLGAHGSPSYAETQRELKAILKEGEKTAKGFLKELWEVYRDHRKTSKQLEVAIDPSWDSLRQLAMALPPKLTKAAVEDRHADRIREIVMRDFRQRAKTRFAEYGAKDALYTLGVRYWLKARFAARPVERHAIERELVANETFICHPIVTELEENGLKIDVALLGHMHAAIAQAIRELRAEVIALWGAELGDGGPTRDTSLDRLTPPSDFAEEGEDDTEQELFNPASTPQVVKIVWDIWGLRPPPWAIQHGEIRQKFRRSDGYCKVDKDVLGWLAENAAEPYRTNIRKLLELRRHEKMMSSFVEPMLRKALVDPEHRLRATFWSVGARTGRFSATDPNVETIPQPFTMPKIVIPPGADPAKPPPGVVLAKEKDKVTKAVRQVWRVESLRRVVIAEKGWKIVSADLAQIENRMTAHVSQDAALLKLFREWDCAECKGNGETTKPLTKCPTCGAKRGKRDKFHPDQPALKGFCLGRDIHSFTATRTGLFEAYGPEEGRDRAKKVNHASTYAMGARTYAQREGLSLKEAERLLEGWHDIFPGVRLLHARVQEQVREHGYVVMWDGAIRRFPAQQLLLRTNCFASWEWEATIREAVNVLMQGGTGRWVKRAMPKIRERLRTHPNPRVRATKLINQVHDSLDHEAYEDVADEVKGIVVHELENVADFSVPILADGASGATWADAK